MGLSIVGAVSKKTYRCSYSGLHQIRWLALLACGAPFEWSNRKEKTYTFGWVTNPVVFPGQEPSADELTAWNWAQMQAGYYFPNLMFHSDCEGRYTPRGKVFGKNLMSGNSKKLLKELEFLKEQLKEDFTFELPEFALEIFNTLYELVKDEVENGKGVLNFY